MGPVLKSLDLNSHTNNLNKRKGKQNKSKKSQSRILHNLVKDKSKHEKKNNGGGRLYSPQFKIQDDIKINSSKNIAPRVPRLPSELDFSYCKKDPTKSIKKSRDI